MAELKYCPYCATELSYIEREGHQNLACTSEACDYVHYDNPTPVVAAIIQMGDAVLLARNVAWPEKFFAIITGFLEKGEDPEEAILREVKEETNLDAEMVSLVGLYPFEQMNQIIITYHVKAEGEIQLSEELAAYKLIPIEKLKPWPMGTGLAVADWLKAQEASSLPT